MPYFGVKSPTKWFGGYQAASEKEAIEKAMREWSATYHGDGSDLSVISVRGPAPQPEYDPSEPEIGWLNNWIQPSRGQFGR